MIATVRRRISQTEPAAVQNASHGVKAAALQTLLRVFAAAAAFWGMTQVTLAQTAKDQPVKIVMFGDSLTAGYLLPAQAAFPTVLEKRLKADGLAVEIANASVSGDTSSGGLARLDWAVPGGTDLVIIELGANDMLRAVDPAVTRDALMRIVTRLQERKIDVVLTGIRALANWGADYEAAFKKLFADIAAERKVPLFPLFYEGVTDNPNLVLSDGMHPNAAGVESMVNRFLPFITPLLRARIAAAPASTK